MNGLGIVIEEKEMDTDGVHMPEEETKRNSYLGVVPVSMVTPDSENEILLPPLPNDETGTVPSSIMSDHKASVATSISNDSCLSLEIETTCKDSLFSEFVQNPTYELNSPSLKIDPLFANLALNEAPQMADQSATTSNNTSPLRRLKNFKKGIRKLSLSKMSAPSMNDLVSNAPTSVRPGVSPLITEETIDSFLSASTIESLHSAAKARKSSLITPMTTPISSPVGSPIITLSENLSSSSKNINDLERNFFRNLNTNGATPEVSTMEDLTKLEDLIKYLNFLNQLKIQVIDAFELTKERLIKFGWCSDDDLNNLQFQKDSSLLQIDTRILQLEKKLNKQYNTSILLCSNNKGQKKSNSVGSSSSSMDNLNYISENSKASSISLKNLESRCFSYPDF